MDQFFPSRRRFIRAVAFTLPALAMPVAGFAADVRRLRFYHTHTGEKLSAVYFESGAYVPEVLASINHLLRDFRSGEVFGIDPGVLDILSASQSLVGRNGVFEVISGFRSSATNEMLRHQSSGVAEHSLHLDGKAIDVRLTGTQTAKLRDAARSLKMGGVGYYGSSDFVHLDTGRTRYW